MTHLFTPRDSVTNARLSMQVSSLDYLKLRLESYTVTNLLDGNKYSVLRADCGLGCRCDAIATKL